MDRLPDLLYDFVTSLIVFLAMVVLVLALLVLATLFMSYILYAWGGVKL